MTATRPALLLTSLALAALLAACGSTTDLSEHAVPVETRNPVAVASQQQAATAATSAATPQSRVATVDLAAQDAARASAAAAALRPSQRIVYFDFDSYAIKDEFKPLIDGHAKALVADKSRRVVVEGHTDERGGSEYNLALGQKRAEAVVKSLELLGVGERQAEAVSFGKERPADPGHDEAAWAKNRRAELKDR